MRRTALWIVLVGAAVVVLGVLWQAFSIAAYVRGAGEDALDAHLTGSFFVHAGEAMRELESRHAASALADRNRSPCRIPCACRYPAFPGACR